jgi:hypothetical protein
MDYKCGWIFDEVVAELVAKTVAHQEAEYKAVKMVLDSDGSIPPYLEWYAEFMTRPYT